MSYTAMELAEVFLKTGELDDALDAINQQLSEHPDDDTARRLRIQIMMRQREPEQLQLALSDVEKIHDKNARDWQMCSIIHERLGNLGNAVAAIQFARDLDPDSERLTERLLDILIASDDYDPALSLIREQERSWRWLEREGDLLVLMGDDTLATARYGLVLSHLSQLESTIQEEYLQALKLRVILASAHCYRRLGHIAPARELYNEAKKIISDDSSIDFNLGLLAALDGDIKQAVDMCRQALKQAPHIIRLEMLQSIENDESLSSLSEYLNASG